MPKNAELDLALQFIEKTDRNLFITGKAGTGKTTFLHNVKAASLKRMVVVAPTGVAAINAKGVMQVIIRSAVGGETIKTLTTHYTVTGAGTASGGNVVFESGDMKNCN